MAAAATVAHYERGGPSLLSREPALPPRARDERVDEDWIDLATHLETRMAMLRAWRTSWWQHWALLAKYILPRRYHFIVTANTMNRGFPINQEIADSTGTLALRTFAAGLMAGMTDPNRRWFKLKPAIPGLELDRAGTQWFEEVEYRLRYVQAESNFYDSLAQMYEDIGVFGTAPVIDYEDKDDIFRCYNPCAGEYFLASGFTFREESFYREFTLTVSQIVEMFGLKNCSQDIRELWASKGGSLENERIVAHAIEPNYAIRGRRGNSANPLKGQWTWREAYWLRGEAAAQRPLSLRGFHEQPYVAPRWAVVSNDPYGRSAGMDALPDIMQLQLETRRKGEGIQKKVRPPMLADITLKNQPTAFTPDGITYVSTLGPGQGARPVYEMNLELAEMVEDIKEIQGRIRGAFFNDVLRPISQLDMAATSRPTATEVDTRKQEALMQLGPFVGRMENEGLSPRIRRQLSIMERKGLLPPPPASLHGVPVQIEYVSMLALALKAQEIGAIERTMSFVANAFPIKPEMADNIDADATVRAYGDDLSAPTKMFLDGQAVAQKRQQRAQAQQAQQAGQTAFAATAAAKNLGGAGIGGDTALGALAGNQAQGNA